MSENVYSTLDAKELELYHMTDRLMDPFHEMEPNSNADESSYKTIFNLDEQRLEREAPCFDGMRESSCYEDAHSPCYLIIPVCMQDVSCHGTNFFQEQYHDQQERLTADIDGRACSSEKMIFAESSLNPEKTRSEYDLQRQTSTPLNQSSTSSVENQPRSDSFAWTNEAFFPSTTLSDAAVFHYREQDCSLDMESGLSELPLPVLDGGGFLYQNLTAMNTDLLKLPALPDDSPGNKENLKNCSQLKVFACSYCSYSTANATRLKTHVLIHTGGRPYGCHVCGDTFKYKSNLKRHTIVHSGVKSHVCSVCAKDFFHKADLKRHKKTHTGERPHACSVCKNTFSQKSNLKAHMRVHTGEKPFACSVCPYNSTSKRNLKKHILAFHPKEEWER